MLTTEKQKQTCQKYSARDSNGKVHCYYCPLRLPQVWSWGACRATHHYDRHRKEWVLDDDHLERWHEELKREKERRKNAAL